MKLALNGQWKDISGPIYTYPEKLSGVPDWLTSVFDPRNARGVFKANYCYAVWYNDNGYYYGCIKTNTDARNGCVMLTLFAEKKVPLDGVSLAEKMRSLLDYCLSKNDPSEIGFVDVSLKAKEIEDILIPRELPQDVVLSAAVDKKTAYRLYANDAELGLFLENPNQHPYAEYKCVLAIESSAFNGDAMASQSLVKITDPIRKTYDIRCESADVELTQTSVVEGDWFDVTYKKQGFVSEKVRVVAGKISTYCFIEGNVINIYSAEAAKINFKSEIILKVVDEETKSIIGKWSCKVDGRTDQVRADDEGFAHIIIDPNKPHKVLVSAEGYQSKEFEIAVGERGYKTAPLRSLDNTVHVSLELDKEMVTDAVRLKSNNALYGPLKEVENNGGALQVKRPFFSRRNLVPIVALVLVALAIGGVAGHFIFRGGGSGTDDRPVDTYALSNENKTLKKQLDSVQNAAKTQQDSLIYFCNEVFRVVIGMEEKGKADNVLDDFGVLLKDKDNKKIRNYIAKIGNEKGTNDSSDADPSKSGGNSGGGSGGNSGGGAKPVSHQAALNEYLRGNDWNLNYLESLTGTSMPNAVTLAQRLREGDIDNLYTFSSFDNYNTTWKELKMKMDGRGIITGKDGKVKDENLREAFSNKIIEQAQTGQINLDDLLKFFDE